MEHTRPAPLEIKALLDYRVHLSAKNVDISGYTIDGDMYVNYKGLVGELFTVLNMAHWLDYKYSPENLSIAPI